MMEIELRRISIRELIAGYEDNDEEGVVGYGGRLDIRPKYQRAFVYKGERKDAVIRSVRNDFPLNVMYWAVKEDGDFEVLDGQQRIVSICRYATNDFSIDHMIFDNLSDTDKEQILDYELMVYFCSGTDKEKLNWFQIVNIAGLELSNQELRNAVYSGPWVSHAKRYFSKSSGPAHDIANRYVKGDPLRQEYLEIAIEWITTDLEFPGGKDDRIREYMSQHQHDDDAGQLWSHFQAVIDWVKRIFPSHRKEMKGVAWGDLYAKFKNERLNPKVLGDKVSLLMKDDEVRKKAGIYPYVLTGEEKHLSLRAFTENQKRTIVEPQGGKCKKCGKDIDFEETEAYHINPWSKGGKTEIENCQVLCRDCNRRKSNK